MKIFLKKIKKYKKKLSIFSIFIIIFFSFSLFLLFDIKEKYQNNLSVIIYDRNEEIISIKTNIKDHYVYETKEIPDDLEKLLLKKEDRYFYWHFGVNPVSNLRALWQISTIQKHGGASTITQQLAKNLLGNENNRTFYNKIKELFYTFNLELFFSKKEILTMYANTTFFGNQAQGFETASRMYFNKDLAKLNHNEQISLLATISYPNNRNPWKDSEQKFATALNQQISPDETFTKPLINKNFNFQNEANFELSSIGFSCEKSCRTTIDVKITEKIRQIIKEYTDKESSRGAKNSSVVVIDPRSEEIIAIVGSVDPSSTRNGNKINMAIKPRPIGSTIKPLMYLKGFEDGLRPYTIVEDREYKYQIGLGFAQYPKNYDGAYQGEVSLHYALSNSLNVPSVKVLEYIGLEKFYNFLDQKLKFEPIQDYDNYQYGIALGGLEMDLTTLTHYFTIFPRLGNIAPLKISTDGQNNFKLAPQNKIESYQEISDKKYVALIHKIISDRLTGVGQFSLESSLNLPIKDYGVKTGTSRDWHDSWVVGYTGDFVVGVWVGNTENTSLQQISGAQGAGVVWNQVMNLMINSKYNHQTSINTSDVMPIKINNSIEWGLTDDDIELSKNLMKEDILILSPHDEDKFEFEKTKSIPLKSSQLVEWTIKKLTNTGDKIIFSDSKKESFWQPSESGYYQIFAKNPETNFSQTIYIKIQADK